MEIKRQITGMMRLLSDKSGRVYQRVGSEQNSTSKESKDNLTCTPVPSPVSEDPRCNNWSSAGDPDLSSSSTSTPIDPIFGQYGTRSRALRIHSSKKEPNGRVTKESSGRRKLLKIFFSRKLFCGKSQTEADNSRQTLMHTSSFVATELESTCAHMSLHVKVSD